jgi:hypothetical protein
LHFDVESAESVLSQPNFSRFLDLPKELRLAIWTLTHPSISSQVIVRNTVARGNDLMKPKFLPNLCGTSGTTFDGTVVSFINVSKFLVSL